MSFDHIKNLMPKAIQKYGIQVECKASHICHLYLKIAPEVFGEKALEFTAANSFKDSKLTIGVVNSVWMQELQLKKHLLLHKINSELGREVVKEIRGVVGIKKVDLPAEES